MSQPNKNDPAREWMFVEKLLLDEEIERVGNLSDKALEDEMRAQGLDPARVPSAEELMAKAKTRAAAQSAAAKNNGPVRMATVTELPKRSRRALGIVTLLAAALGGFVLVQRSSEPVTVGHPYSPETHAASLRERAFTACRNRMWTECQEKLDEAQKIAPVGESEPRVQQARKEIAGALRVESGTAAPEPKREK